MAEWIEGCDQKRTVHQKAGLGSKGQMEFRA